MAEMVELIITLSDGREIRRALGARPIVIGRDSSCEIPLDDPSASRRHARFAPTAHGYLVEDLGSKNGTLVNGAPCTSKLLKNGDQVQIGSTVAVYTESAGSTAGSVVISEDATVSHATRYISRERRLALSQQRLQMIYELSERLTTLQSRDSLLENAMDICFETLSFERGAIGIRQRVPRGLDWPVVRNLRGAEGELTISRTLLVRALEHGERAIFNEDDTATTDPTVSMVQHGIRSAMCVPLIHQDEILGVIYGDQVSTSASYAAEDIDFLAGIAQQVSIGLVNCRLAEDHQQMIRLNHDIDLARTIQTELFPTDLPDRPELKIAALNEPGDRVSGDYYDVIETGDGRVWCIMADVTGEGVAAALLMANLQAAVRVTIEETDDPGTLLRRWNEVIWRNTDSSKFITCLLALLDPKSHRIHFASAGHHLPLVVRASQPHPEKLTGEAGYPLGIMEEVEYPTTTADLGPEPFAFFCCTDGVIEAMNNDRQQYGSDRLLQTLSEVGELDPQPLMKHVREDIAGFVAGAKQSDDLTMLAALVS
ncbi:MAG: SpoIIE family protein phosphatase [Phycisphaerales bacterium]|nr:MAG: SpoIIE family protein phosphatase [Phycisphaerales bacterium]